MPSVKRLAYLSVVLIALSAVAIETDEAPSALWSKFEQTRQGTRNLHQEFEVTEHIRSSYGNTFSRHDIVIDLAQNKWRERSLGGAGNLIRIFDGQDVFLIDADGTEYKRTHHRGDKDEALPEPYATKVNWGKAKELEHLPCGFAGKDHVCIVIEAPVEPWLRTNRSEDVTTMSNGTIRITIDTETGIWLRTQMSALISRSNSDSQIELMYTAKQMTYGAAPDLTLFKLPDGLREVRELTPWDKARIKKELAGKPAPDLRATDIQGKPVSLADLKGKTVLLDFWTTWCPPCQADALSIEQLSQKYSKDLQVIGISVDEEREIVEKYLKKHPHNFPVILSSENLLPRPYQISLFPTYLIIAPDGTLTTAEQGDQGFGRLKKALEKAGMQTE